MKILDLIPKWVNLLTILFLAISLTMSLVSRTISEDDNSALLLQFQKSTDVLANSYQRLIADANFIEDDHALDEMSFEQQAYSPENVKKKEIFTEDQIELRSDAVRALSQYTLGLVGLASGRSAEAIAEDASSFGSTLKKLSDKAGTITVITSKKKTDSKLLTANQLITNAGEAGTEVMVTIANHRSRAEIRRSLQKNDPKIDALFQMIANESSALFERKRSTLGAQGVYLYANYNQEARKEHPDRAILLDYSDRIKQFERSQYLLRGEDPTPAIVSFRKAHDAVVSAILAPSSIDSHISTQFWESIRDFASEAEPQPINLDIPAQTIPAVNAGR